LTIEANQRFTKDETAATSDPDTPSKYLSVEPWLTDPLLRDQLLTFSRKKHNSENVEFALAEFGYRKNFDKSEADKMREAALDLYNEFCLDDSDLQIYLHSNQMKKLTDAIHASAPMTVDLFKDGRLLALAAIKDEIIPAYLAEQKAAKRIQSFSRSKTASRGFRTARMAEQKMTREKFGTDKTVQLLGLESGTNANNAKARSMLRGDSDAARAGATAGAAEAALAKAARGDEVRAKRQAQAAESKVNTGKYGASKTVQLLGLGQSPGTNVNNLKARALLRGATESEIKGATAGAAEAALAKAARGDEVRAKRQAQAAESKVNEEKYGADKTVKLLGLVQPQGTNANNPKARALLRGATESEIKGATAGAAEAALERSSRREEQVSDRGIVTLSVAG
jgi:hypothetical protein